MNLKNLGKSIIWTKSCRWEKIFRLPQISWRQICYFHTLPPSLSFYLILSQTFIKNKKFSISWLFLFLTPSSTSLSLLPLELPHTSTFPFSLFNSLSNFYLKKKIISHGSSSTSPLHLPLSSSHLLNSLTFSSLQLIILPFHLPFSHFHFLNSLTSLSLQLIAHPISYLNPMLGFFFFLISLWFLWFYYCLSLKGTFFPFWFLCLFFVAVFT